ncbi:MAG: hypothetical protein ACK4Q5_16590 [Saprospiraceae bacterium]
MSTLNKYPIKDGWLHMKFKLKAGHNLDEFEMKRLATFQKPLDDYEFAVVRVGKVSATVILRRKPVIEEG